ncbi:MAG: DolP-mannose mannosyltransferase [Halobacteriaceae archaeon]
MALTTERRLSPTMDRPRLDLDWWSDIVTLVLGALLVANHLALIHRFRSLAFVRQDTAFFVWSGAQVASGRLPYVDYWDIKPPAIHELMGLLGLVAGGDLQVLAALGLLTSITAVGGLVYLLARTTYTVTESEVAAFAAALSPLVLREFYLSAVMDVRVQVFTALFTVVPLSLFAHGREGPAVGAAALSAAFWQPGIGIVAVTMYGAWRRGALRSGVVWLAGVTAVVLAPFLARGTLDPVFAQTVLAPLLIERQEPLIAVLVVLTESLGLGIVVLVVAGAAIVLDRRVEHTIPRTTVAVIVGSFAWYVGYVALVSLDGPVDLLPLLAVSGLCVGLTVGILPAELADPEGRFAVDPRRVVVGTLLLAVALELLWLRNWPYGMEPGHTPVGTYLDATGCHVRNSHQERWWIDVVQSSPYIEHCGDVDVTGIIWSTVRAAFGVR